MSFFSNLDFKRGVNWKPALFIGIYQILWILLFPFYLYFANFHLSTWILAFALLYITGLSITAGYHRYFAHKAYKAHPIVEGILLFFGSMAAQGSALRWAFDHRIHHAEVDTENDPYSIKKGFWYAHFLWILEKPRTIDPKVVSDLLKKKNVQFQHTWYPLAMVVTNGIAFAVASAITQDFWGAFFVVVFGRMFALHHFTWFINSLAHTWGDKPFSQEQTAVDNYFLSLLTFGEGYHNYHHTFANDYRNGVRWYHFDPTKWLIFSLSFFGLTKSLRRTDPLLIQKRMIQERKKEVLEKLTSLWHVQKETLEGKINQLSGQLSQRFSDLIKLKEEIKSAEKTTRQLLKKEFKLLKKTLKQDWKEWKILCQSVDNLNTFQPT